MAVFKVPRITTIQREDLILDIGEIVYDTDQNIFYGGDGVNAGGFLIGSGVGSTTSTITITEADLLNKYVTLPTTPYFPNSVTLRCVGGIEQLNGIDFQVIDNKIQWNEMGLDGFLEINDVLIIQH